MKTSILLVDNDSESLEELTNSLKALSNEWSVTGHADPETVLEKISSIEPSIVICGHHLPALDGVALLEQIEAEHPHIHRFIYAAPEDKELLEAGIGDSYQFLPRPCSQNALINELQRVVSLEDWLGRDRIKEIVSSIGDFPSLPPMYMKVVNAVNSTSASTESIAAAITGDIAITAKLLQTVNSSYFALEEKVSDISHAISILGIESVKNVVLAIQVFGGLKDKEQQALVDQLWHHSMSVATAAKRVAKYETKDNKVAEEAYTAGLFHDIGKLVLIKSLPEKYAEIRELISKENIPSWEAEEKVIGCNHTEIGAYLLGRWGMPIGIIEAVAHHHKPTDSFTSDFSTLAAVHAGNALVWERHPGENKHPDAEPHSEFLSHIGHIASWDAWRDASTGKITEKPEPAATVSSGSETHSESSTEKAVLSEAGATGTNSVKESPASNSGKGWLIGSIAAALIVCAWVFVGQKETAEPLQEIAETSEEWTAPATDAEATGAASIEPEKVEIADAETSEAEESAPVSEEAATEPELAVADSEPASEEPSAAPAEEIAESDPEPVAPEVQPEEETEVAAAPAVEEPVDTFPRIRLTGIFYNQSNPLASVNGKLLRRGDSVSGARVVDIDSKYILVSYNGESRKIALPK